MLRPSEDIDRRRPVWGALSELFLDTELDEATLRGIAQTLVDSGYADLELEAILYDEVFAVCIWNMLSVAGEWEGIDPDWLQERILINERKAWTRWRWWQPRSFVENAWRKVLRLVHEQRARSFD